MNRAHDSETTDAATPQGGTDAVIGGMLGWLFILVGSAAVAAASLIPSYLDTLDLQQARKVEQIKAGMLGAELQRYIDFHDALLADDPVLIERLAMTELRLKPYGTGVADQSAFDPVALVDAPTTAAINRAIQRQPLMRSIENELSRPDLKQQARISVEIARPRRTRLVEAATGELRPLVAGLGAVLLLMGLWPRRTAAG